MRGFLPTALRALCGSSRAPPCMGRRRGGGLAPRAAVFFLLPRTYISRSLFVVLVQNGTHLLTRPAAGLPAQVCAIASSPSELAGVVWCLQGSSSLLLCSKVGNSAVYTKKWILCYTTSCWVLGSLCLPSALAAALYVQMMTIKFS